MKSESLEGYRLNQKRLNKYERLKTFFDLLLAQNEKDFVEAYSKLTGRKSGFWTYGKLIGSYDKKYRAKRSGK